MILRIRLSSKRINSAFEGNYSSSPSDNNIGETTDYNLMAPNSTYQPNFDSSFDLDNQFHWKIVDFFKMKNILKTWCCWASNLDLPLPNQPLHSYQYRGQSSTEGRTHRLITSINQEAMSSKVDGIHRFSPANSELK